MDAFEKARQVLPPSTSRRSRRPTSRSCSSTSPKSSAVRATRPGRAATRSRRCSTYRPRARAVPASCACVCIPRTRARPPPPARRAGLGAAQREAREEPQGGRREPAAGGAVIHYLNDMLEHAQKELDESRFMPQIMDSASSRCSALHERARATAAPDHHPVVGLGRAPTAPSSPAGRAAARAGHRISRATAATRRPRPGAPGAQALDAERDRGLPNVRGRS